MIGRQFCDKHRLARRNVVEVRGRGKARAHRGFEIADFKWRKAASYCC